jgi:hypothetical protein
MLDRARAAAAPSSNLLKRVLASRRFQFALVIVLFTAAFIVVPWLFWLEAPELPLKITVVDKTVPFKDRREHKALYWLFYQNKFVDSAKPADKRWYDYREDYVGFFPINMPNKHDETLLSKALLADRDVLYFADTYGVYTLDYRQFPGDIASTKHSGIIFGGVTDQDVEAVEWFAGQGRTVIGEFNTFASPTAVQIRTRMENVFGVKWTGWIGRYFVDFADEKDVPFWLFQLYKEKAGKEWDLKGSGYMLCREEQNDFIILQADKDVLPKGLTFEPSGPYENDDVMQGVKPSTFVYWFDVVTPQPGTDVLATYAWHLTPEGRDKLAEKGLALSMPAVTRKQINYTAYYMAGEFLDFNKAMGQPNSRLTMYINRSFYGKPVAGSAGYPFWHSGYPLITNILRRESNRLYGIPENVYLFK